MKFRDFAREFAIGCSTHFLLALAAAVLLGGAVHYWGFSGRTLFVLIALVLFTSAVFLPWKRRKRQPQ
jgi:membrane protein DedA with SNARE-associated domain